MTERLGNITELDSAQRVNRDKNVTRRYRLLDTVRELLPDMRVRACLHIPIPTQEITIRREADSEKVHLHGVGCCASPWICPVCAVKISMGRMAEVLEAIQAVRARGGFVYFVTLTARHTRADALSDNLRMGKSALRWMRMCRAWHTLRGEYGIFGQIDKTEITWGFGAGWHVHFHTLYFSDKRVSMETLERLIFGQWQPALERHGLDCDRDHGVKVIESLEGDVTDGDEQIAGYIAKCSLGMELAASEKDGRKRNYGVFQLLALYEAGEDWAGGLFQEYAQATKGCSSLRFSRGLRKELGLSESAKDEALVEMEVSEGSRVILILPWEDYKHLIYSGRRGIIGEMLVIAERGRDALLIWLRLFGISPP